MALVSYPLHNKVLEIMILCPSTILAVKMKSIFYFSSPSMTYFKVISMENGYLCSIDLPLFSDTDPAKYGTRPPTFMPEFPTSPTEPTGKTENPTPAIPFTPFSVEVPNDHVLIGEKYLNRASSILSSSARTAFILTKLKFPLSCLVVAFHAYVVQPGKVYFQIWRGHDDSGSKFELIGQKGITVEGTIVDGFEPRLMQIMLENDEQIYVKEGDCIGLSNDQETSVIGYHFQASSTYSSEQPISPAIGDIVTFDQLSHPYKFALAATLKKGK